MQSSRRVAARSFAAGLRRLGGWCVSGAGGLDLRLLRWGRRWRGRLLRPAWWPDLGRRLDPCVGGRIWDGSPGSVRRWLDLGRLPPNLRGARGGAGPAGGEVCSCGMRVRAEVVGPWMLSRRGGLLLPSRWGGPIWDLLGLGGPLVGAAVQGVADLATAGAAGDGGAAVPAGCG